MIVVIIPAYNEEKTIAQTVSALYPLIDRVVVVDDGSLDQTATKARAAGALVVSHLINRGYGAALVTGQDLALRLGADYLVHFDGDGQFESKEITRLLEPLLQGKVDIVLGSRFLTNNKIPWLRRIVLKLAIWFTWVWSGIKLTDAHNGFRALTRKVAQQWRLQQDRMAVSSEIIDEITRLKLRYMEAPVTVHYTQYSLTKGQSNLGAWRIIKDLFLTKFLR